MSGIILTTSFKYHLKWLGNHGWWVWLTPYICGYHEWGHPYQWYYKGSQINTPVYQWANIDVRGVSLTFLAIITDMEPQPNYYLLNFRMIYSTLLIMELIPHRLVLKFQVFLSKRAVMTVVFNLEEGFIEVIINITVKNVYMFFMNSSTLLMVPTAKIGFDSIKTFPG